MFRSLRVCEVEDCFWKKTEDVRLHRDVRYSHTINSPYQPLKLCAMHTTNSTARTPESITAGCCSRLLAEGFFSLYLRYLCLGECGRYAAVGFTGINFVRFVDLRIQRCTGFRSHGENVHLRREAGGRWEGESIERRVFRPDVEIVGSWVYIAHSLSFLLAIVTRFCSLEIRLVVRYY